MASSTRQRRKADEILQEHRRGFFGFPRRFQRRAAFPPTSPGVTTGDDMPRLTPDARQAANVDAYKAALSAFWGNMTALEQIVEEDFPDGANETIAPTRYQVDAIRDLGNRVGALVEGYSVTVPF